MIGEHRIFSVAPLCCFLFSQFSFADPDPYGQKQFQKERNNEVAANYSQNNFNDCRGEKFFF
jgi:hypothetical protein